MAQLVPLAAAVVAASSVATTVSSIQARNAQARATSLQNQVNANQRLNQEADLANTRADTLSRLRARLVAQGLVPVAGSSAQALLDRTDDALATTAARTTTTNDLLDQRDSARLAAANPDARNAADTLSLAAKLGRNLTP